MNGKWENENEIDETTKESLYIHQENLQRTKATKEAREEIKLEAK